MAFGDDILHVALGVLGDILECQQESRADSTSPREGVICGLHGHGEAPLSPRGRRLLFI